MLSSYRQPIFGALRDQASDVILTGIPEQQRAKMRGRRISDQPESGKHDEVLQMFSLNVDLLTNLPIRPIGYRKSYGVFGTFEPLGPVLGLGGSKLHIRAFERTKGIHHLMGPKAGDTLRRCRLGI